MYKIRVLRADGHVSHIYRRYSEFNELHHKLAAAVGDKARATLPSFPSKIYMGRSHTRQVALKRMRLLNQYLRVLLAMGEQVVGTALVHTFFKAMPRDDVDNTTALEEVWLWMQQMVEGWQDEPCVCVCVCPLCVCVYCVCVYVCVLCVCDMRAKVHSCRHVFARLPLELTVCMFPHLLVVWQDARGSMSTSEVCDLLSATLAVVNGGQHFLTGACLHVCLCLCTCVLWLCFSLERCS